MKFAGKIILGIGVVLLAALGARGDGLALSATPYDTIVARNAFGLVPMPTNPPADTKPPDPPAKITPNGIMSLFGQLQVLFKVATPPKPGQPPQDQSYVMSEGDRQDGIAVNKIDEQAGMITFDNHGIIQKLALTAATNISGPVTRVGPGPTVGLPNRRFFGGRPGGRGPVSPIGGGANSYAGASSGNATPSSVPGYGPSPANFNNGADRITPEAQVILMEAQRQQFQQAGDPAQLIIPPTPLSPLLQDQTPQVPNP